MQTVNDATLAARAAVSAIQSAARAEMAALLADRNALHDALYAAVAFVELYTCNGVRQQPPSWALSEDGDGFDAEKIALRAREVLNGEV